MKGDSACLHWLCRLAGPCNRHCCNSSSLGWWAHITQLLYSYAHSCDQQAMQHSRLASSATWAVRVGRLQQQQQQQQPSLSTACMHFCWTSTLVACTCAPLSAAAALEHSMLLLLSMPQLLRPQQQQQQDPREAADSDTPCFVECVSQVNTTEEMQSALTEAGPDALVVVDFYKTACGACKYIQPG
jgi:hypothetical protein